MLNTPPSRWKPSDIFLPAAIENRYSGQSWSRLPDIERRTAVIGFYFLAAIAVLLIASALLCQIDEHIFGSIESIRPGLTESDLAPKTYILTVTFPGRGISAGKNGRYVKLNLTDGHTIVHLERTAYGVDKCEAHTSEPCSSDSTVRQFARWQVAVAERDLGPELTGGIFNVRGTGETTTGRKSLLAAWYRLLRGRY